METQTIGAYDAKTHLPRLLDEVAQGQILVINSYAEHVLDLLAEEDALVPQGIGLWS